MDLDPIEKEAFANEVIDRLEEYNDYLLDFETAASDEGILHKLFRVAHTIKGNAGFVGLTNMVEIAHAAENLLSLIRDGKLTLDRELSDLLFAAGDRIKQILDAFLSDEADPLSIDISDAAQNIEAAIQKRLPGAAPTPSATPPNTQPSSLEESLPQEPASRASGQDKTDEPSTEDFLEVGHLAETPAATEQEAPLPDQSALFGWNIEIQLKKGIALPGMRAYLLRSKLEKVAKILSEDPPVEHYDNKDFGGKFSFLVESTEDETSLHKVLKNHEVESCTILPASATTPAQTQEKGAKAQETQGRTSIASSTAPDAAPSTALQDTSTKGAPEEALLFQVGDDQKALHSRSGARPLEALRVPIQKIDDILNLVGELLSANSAYLALAADFRAQYGNRGLYVHLRDNSEELARISAELQEKVMRVRMVPISSVFSRFRRLLRDYNARHPDKEAVLEIIGEETEVDKKQMDSLFDPLMHLLRNALDHGIEPKETRKALGKNPVGQILLKSYQDGNSIYLEVSDDGKGLDLDKIRSKAIERGLVSKEKIDTYSDLELQNLIFLPGFSTASRVTEVSGRGVGMDVVRKNIESIGGSISIHSTKGSGSVFRIQIPLSMAVVTALKIFIQNQLFAIPISVILETTKVLEKDILTIEGSETIRLRDEHISLLRAEQAMGFPKKHKASPEDKRPVVVVQYGEDKIALMVDELIGYEDMVIKSLSKNYEEIEGIAGAALLGRGEICLILDVHRLIGSILDRENKRFENNSRRLLSQIQTPLSGQAPSPEASQKPEAETKSLPKPPAQINEAAAKKAGLSPEELRIIKEIVSRGRKAALIALQKLTANTRLRMKVSSARIQSLHRFEDTVREICTEKDCQAFYVNLEGDLRGNEIALLQKENMIHLARMLYQDPGISVLDEAALSAIQELTNILAVSFTNAMSHVADLHVLPSPPYHVPDAKEIFAQGLLFERDASATILLVETEFMDPGDSSMLRFYLMPDQKGFARLISPTAAP